mgnify:CR=1 FL=1
MPRWQAANPRPKIRRAAPPPLDRRALARIAGEAVLIEWILRRRGLKPVNLGRKPVVERPLPPRPAYRFKAKASAVAAGGLETLGISA